MELKIPIKEFIAHQDALKKKNTLYMEHGYTEMIPVFVEQESITR